MRVLALAAKTGKTTLLALVALTALLSGLLILGGAAQTANAQAGVTNSCPAGDISIALYGGSVSNGLVAGNRFLNEDAGFCVQVIPEADWALMTVAEYRLFDVLWIGNDDCSGDSASDFDTAAATVTTWEVAIDPGSVMVAGGDYDFHYENRQANAIAVTQALVTEISDAAAPGLVLQAGCYGVRGAPWLQNLGGTFTGLSHAHTRNGDPSPAEVFGAHEFNTKYGFDSASYRFGSSCHGGLAVDPAAPVANYQLQPLFDFNGAPCFMFSDATVAPTFVGNIGDTIWCETTVNGTFDAGEGIAGVTVSLLGAGGAVAATATTTGDGAYLFADQPVGAYTVSVDLATLPATCNVVAVAPDGGTDAMATVTTTVSSVTNLEQDFGFQAPVPGTTPAPTTPPVTPPPATPPPAPIITPADPVPSIVITNAPPETPGLFEAPEIQPTEPTESTDEVLGIVVEAETTTVIAVTGVTSSYLATFGLVLLGFGAHVLGTARLSSRRRESEVLAPPWTEIG